MATKISVEESCDRLDETWRPRVIAALNGQEVKLVRAKGVFPWHRHDDVDENTGSLPENEFTAPCGVSIAGASHASSVRPSAEPLVRFLDRHRAR